MHSVSFKEEARNSYFKRLCLPLVFSFLFISLLSLVGYMYTNSEKELEKGLERLQAKEDHLQEILSQVSYSAPIDQKKLHLYAKLLSNYTKIFQQFKKETRNRTKVTQAPEKKPFAAIQMVGRNYQKQQSQKDTAIYNWKTTLQTGNISSFQDSYIIIKSSGYYYVYAQMFFSENKDFRKDVLQFYVRKNRLSKIVNATVPRSACQTYCTKYIARIVKLTKDDDLSIATADSGINFSMSPDKAQFGAYLLMKA
ncbi:tumor necrosis factor ligand superfamily member 13B-like [Hydractinia symbiolongicarpus]|uniref:tumor necrosis factor ligand superfamily member 13B-like n=1 Tax=Hydractinia symbiolongicarpus TaxID=13093 RepID=UPI00254C3C05|nr:tumor necrosis factor ligand superfamily member 13B-like [Hydractinia symbiolongicarpus]